MIFSTVSHSYEALSQREKILIMLSSLAALLALLFMLLLEPQYLLLQESTLKYQRVEASLKVDQRQEEKLQQQLSDNLEQSIQQQIDDLADQQKVIADDLLQVNVAVLSPQALTQFLAGMMLYANSLQVERFELNAEAFSGADEILAEKDAFVLKQSITMRVQGDKSQILAFITSIEAMSVAIVWDSISSQNLDESQRDVTIDFHLFSAIE